MKKILQLPEEWTGWNLMEIIGEGTTGVVWRAEKRTDNGIETSAIKIIQITPQDETQQMLISLFHREDVVRMQLAEQLQACIREIKIMQLLHTDPHIVQLQDYAICENPDSLGWTVFIRMEYLEKMESHIKSFLPVFNDSGMLPNHVYDELCKLTSDICDALSACHNHNIIHRDVKPENLFWSEKDGYKLGDFGVACFGDDIAECSASTGTLSYMAPEIYHCESYDQTVDLYSLGLIIYRILNKGQIPFMNVNKPFTYSQVEQAIMLRMEGKEIPLPYYNAPFVSGIMTACHFRADQRFKTAMGMKLFFVNSLNT